MCCRLRPRLHVTGVHGSKGTGVDHGQGRHQGPPRALSVLGFELGGLFAAGPELRLLQRTHKLPRLLASAQPRLAAPSSPSFAARPVWQAHERAASASVVGAKQQVRRAGGSRLW